MVLVDERQITGIEECKSKMGSSFVSSELLTPAADFSYWCRLAVWTLEEAAALCLGLDFTSRSAPTLAHNERFLRKLRLVTRANQVGLIPDPVPPSEFASWAQGNDIMFPAELRQAVTNRAKNWIDWQTEAQKYEAAAQRAAESFDFYKKQAQQKEGRIKHLEEELAAARKSAKRIQISDPETVNPKSFATLLKLVGGMAIAIYNFSPSESRSDVVRQIQSDLDLKGISLDADTIRKWVRKGAKAAIPAHEA